MKLNYEELNTFEMILPLIRRTERNCQVVSETIHWFLMQLCQCTSFKILVISKLQLF